GASRARLQTPRVLTVLADVRRELPRQQPGIVPTTTNRRRLLDELHVPPGRGAERAGVVVRVPGEQQPILRHLVPLLARHLARLAPDAKRRVRQEACDPRGLHAHVSQIRRRAERAPGRRAPVRAQTSSSSTDGIPTEAGTSGARWRPKRRSPGITPPPLPTAAAHPLHEVAARAPTNTPAPSPP